MTMISIFTPVYNRASELERLYQSLCAQTNMNFIWLIVDDGSTDDVEQRVEDWQKQSPFPIEFYTKDNGGKHTAHNLGVDQCTTEFFICVDSDDVLTEYAVEIMYEKAEMVQNDSQLAGVLFPSWDGQKRPRFPRNVQRASIRELYDRYGYRGETALLFKTDILKQYKFPVFEGERFVVESVVYDRISVHYKMLLSEEYFYLRVYQADGYTRNIDSVHRNNPIGFMYDVHQRMNLAEGFFDVYRQHTRYVMWCLVYKFENPYQMSPKKWMTILATPMGFLLYVKCKRDMRRGV